MSLQWMADAFRKHGLKVVETDGWVGRGRPYTFTPNSVMFHHTASSKDGGDAPAKGTVTVGRPDIPGPLCNILVGRSGKVYLIAAGYANHGGLGGPWGDIPKDSANRYAVGIEVENNGIGESWPPEQLKAVAELGAILLHHFKRPVRYFFGHKEWTTRKIDPARIDMDAFRKRVRETEKRLFPPDYDYVVNGTRYEQLNHAAHRMERDLSNGKRVRARRVKGA